MASALVWDWGLFPELALRIARELGDCLYFSPWASSCPTPRDQLYGQGLEQFGVTRVDFPLRLIDTDEEPAIWIFPDLYSPDIQGLLRQMGKAVWGAGWGELMECDRWKLLSVLKQAGQPTPETETVNGVETLARRLKSEAPAIIKIAQYYRGLMETYKHRGWPQSQAQVDELRHDLGPAGNELRFMLQQPIAGKCVEPGVDLILVNRVPLFPATLGYEEKDLGLISKRITELPEVLAAPVEAVMAALPQDYSGCFSGELRVTEEGTAYFIDATTRMPRPGDAIHMELCENLADVIGAGSRSQEVTPELGGKYACQIMLDAPGAKGRPLHVSFPPEIRDNVKLYFTYCDEHGEYWVLPKDNLTQVASVVAAGDDLEQVKAAALEYAEMVEADGLTYQKNVFELIEQNIAQGRKNGVEF